MRAIIVCVALLLSSCADFITTSRGSLTVVAKLEERGATALVEYDKKHMAQLVNEAPTKEAGRLALQGYREKRAIAVKAFQAIFIATVAAAKTIELYALGLAGKLEVSNAIATVFKAVDEMKNALIQLGVPMIPGLSTIGD